MGPERDYVPYRGNIPADQYDRLVADGLLNPDGTEPGSINVEAVQDFLTLPVVIALCSKKVKSTLAGLRERLSIKK